MMVMLFNLLPSVLLVADEHFHRSVAYEQRVVPHSLVVVNLLVGHHTGVGLAASFSDEVARCCVSFALHDARCEVVVGEFQVGIAPVAVGAQQSRQGAFLETRVGHIAVVAVLVVVCHLLAPPPVPHPSVAVAGEVCRVAEESVVGLVFCSHVGLHRVAWHDGVVVEDEHAGHGVGAVDQCGRSFQNLYGVHALGVDFNAVFVAPLLAFLTDAVAHHEHPVVAQSAYHRFRDASARGNLCHARLLRQGVYDVGGGCGHELARRDDAHR